MKSTATKRVLAPHVRKGHYRTIGKYQKWIAPTIVHSEEFYRSFNTISIDQRIKYRLHFIASEDRNLNLFPYAGSKYRYKEHFKTALRELNPQPVKNFIELCAGALSSFSFLNQMVKAENYIINDNNPRLFNLYREIKHNPEALIEKLREFEDRYNVSLPTDASIKKGRVPKEQRGSMHSAQSVYFEVRNVFNQNKLDTDAAASLIFVQVHSVNGFYRESKTGNYTNGFNWANTRSNINRTINAIIDMHIVFTEKKVQIECMDMSDLLKKHPDPDSFLYTDPPYYKSGLNYHEGMFTGSMEDHLNLIEQTRFHKYLLYSNSYHEALIEPFDGFVDFTRHVEVGGKKSASKKRREILAYRSNVSTVTMTAPAIKSNESA